MFTIRPLNTGWISADPRTYLYYSAAIDYKIMPNDNRIFLPCFAFLLEGSSELVLIDTGMPDQERVNKIHKESHSGTIQLQEQKLSYQLNKCGYDLGDITKVIFTHLHWDHTGALECINDAELFVSEEEIKFAKNPIPPYYKAYDHISLNLGNPFIHREFTYIKGEQEIIDGIKVFLTPGHSPGHLSVEITTNSGPFICAGDALFLRDNIESIVELGYDVVPPGKVCDIVAGWNSVRNCETEGYK